ncbi:hypothetical protein E2K80_05400 [Rhodophyticola sp. CCM32]|uniref:hypothetical protein n=1 Tax=Rhodophyticola sp. CCM32 TaxID=2916397 RepID=UPI00107F8310|nr:hypothetical protein [Rhodophyticola sp. CCM32]QBY00241.1 hypothetical protein E2K80_05400 [Rhodophyticola sp. CCM32]
MFAAPAIIVSSETSVRSSVFCACHTPIKTTAPSMEATIFELVCIRVSLSRDLSVDCAYGGRPLRLQSDFDRFVAKVDQSVQNVITEGFSIESSDGHLDPQANIGIKGASRIWQINVTEANRLSDCCQATNETEFRAFSDLNEYSGGACGGFTKAVQMNEARVSVPKRSGVLTHGEYQEFR